MPGLITNEDLRRSVDRITATPQSQGDRLVQEMAARQPALLSYLLSADPALFTADELGSILFFGMVLWEAARACLPVPPNVTKTSLQRAEEWNLALLEGLVGGDERQEPTGEISTALEGYPEGQALGYLIQSIFPGPESASQADFREQIRYYAFFHLKVALDALLSLPPEDHPISADAP